MQTEKLRETLYAPRGIRSRGPLDVKEKSYRLDHWPCFLSSADYYHQYTEKSLLGLLYGLLIAPFLSIPHGMDSTVFNVIFAIVHFWAFTFYDY